MIIEVVRVPADGVITHKERRALITRDAGLVDSTGILVLAEFNNDCPEQWIERFLNTWNTQEVAFLYNRGAAQQLVDGIRKLAERDR